MNPVEKAVRPMSESPKEGAFSYEHEDPEKMLYKREVRYAGRDADTKTQFIHKP